MTGLEQTEVAAEALLSAAFAWLPSGANLRRVGASAVISVPGEQYVCLVVTMREHLNGTDLSAGRGASAATGATAATRKDSSSAGTGRHEGSSRVNLVVQAATVLADPLAAFAACLSRLPGLVGTKERQALARYLKRSGTHVAVRLSYPPLRG